MTKADQKVVIKLCLKAEKALGNGDDCVFYANIDKIAKMNLDFDNVHGNYEDTRDWFFGLRDKAIERIQGDIAQFKELQGRVERSEDPAKLERAVKKITEINLAEKLSYFAGTEESQEQCNRLLNLACVKMENAKADASTPAPMCIMGRAELYMPEELLGQIFDSVLVGNINFWQLKVTLWWRKAPALVLVCKAWQKVVQPLISTPEFFASLNLDDVFPESKYKLDVISASDWETTFGADKLEEWGLDVAGEPPLTKEDFQFIRENYDKLQIQSEKFSTLGKGYTILTIPGGLDWEKLKVAAGAGNNVIEIHEDTELPKDFRRERFERVERRILSNGFVLGTRDLVVYHDVDKRLKRDCKINKRYEHNRRLPFLLPVGGDKSFKAQEKYVTKQGWDVVEGLPLAALMMMQYKVHKISLFQLSGSYLQEGKSCCSASEGRDGRRLTFHIVTPMAPLFGGLLRNQQLHVDTSFNQLCSKEISTDGGVGASLELPCSEAAGIALEEAARKAAEEEAVRKAAELTSSKARSRRRK
jgi:hypothetical protein